MKVRARLFVIALAYCLLAGTLPSSADAGVYTVSYCHFRDGMPAPTDLWRVMSPQAGAAYDVSCVDGSGLGVRLTRDRTYPRGYLTGVLVQAPPDLVITAASVQDQQWSSGATDWSFAAGYWGSPPGVAAWDRISICEGSNACVGTPTDWHLVYRGEGLQNFGLGVSCVDTKPKACPSSSVAAAYATGVELTVADKYSPTFLEDPSGTLLDPRSAARVRTLRYALADRGAGLRSVALQVDGKTVRESLLARVLATCAPPYGMFAPCPSQASGTFEVDTSAFSPGRHVARLIASDASDGPPLAYDFTFTAPGPPVSAQSCAVGRSLEVHLSHLPLRYGAQTLRFSVQGLAVPTPTVVVMEQRGGSFTPIGPATLRGHRYVAHVRMTTPRILRVAAPVDGGAAYACSDPLALTIRAGLRLTVGPRSVFNGQTIHFRGRLMGGPVARNRIVEIQARVHGSDHPWTLVRTVRTRTTGRFRMSYTFRRTRQRVRFDFRAVRRASDGFPYAFGASNTRTVLVRG